MSRQNSRCWKRDINVKIMCQHLEGRSFGDILSLGMANKAVPLGILKADGSLSLRYLSCVSVHVCLFLVGVYLILFLVCVYVPLFLSRVGWLGRSLSCLFASFFLGGVCSDGWCFKEVRVCESCRRKALRKVLLKCWPKV